MRNKEVIRITRYGHQIIEDGVSSETFIAKPAKYLDAVRRSGQRLMITDEEKASLILITQEAFERLEHAAREFLPAGFVPGTELNRHGLDRIFDLVVNEIESVWLAGQREGKTPGSNLVLSYSDGRATRLPSGFDQEILLFAYKVLQGEVARKLIL